MSFLGQSAGSGLAPCQPNLDSGLTVDLRVKLSWMEAQYKQQQTVMFGHGKQRAFCTTPLKTPSPDTSNRSFINHTQSPDFKFLTVSSRPATNNSFFVDQVSNLRRENLELRQELNKLRSERSASHSRVVSDEKDQTKPVQEVILRTKTKEKILPLEEGQEDGQARPELVKQKDRLICKLEHEVNDLYKKLEDLSLVDSSKLSGLQKENKRLKDVIEMSVDSRPDPALKMTNDKLEQRIEDLTQQILRIKQSKNHSPADSQSFLVLQQNYQRQFQRCLSRIQEQGEHFLDKLGQAESNLFRVQDRIELVKHKVPKIISGTGTSYQSPVVETNQTATQTHRRLDQTNQCLSISVLSSANNQQQQSQSHQNQVPQPSIAQFQQEGAKGTPRLQQQERQQYESTIVGLRREIETLRQELEVAGCEITAMRGSPSFGEAQALEYLRREIERLKQIIQASKKPQGPTRQQIVSRQLAIKELDCQNRQLREVVQQLERQLEFLHNSPSQAREGVAELAQQVQSLRVQNQDLANGLSERMQSKNQELLQASRQIESLKRQKEDIQRKFNVLESERATLQKKVDKSPSLQAINTLAIRVEELETDNLEVREDGRRMSQLCCELQARIEAGEGQIRALQQDLDHSTSHTQDLQRAANQQNYFLESVLQEVRTTRNALSDVDFGSLVTILQSADPGLKFGSVKACLQKAGRLGSQIQNVDSYKQNSLKLTQLNMKLQRATQASELSLLQQKQTNKRLDSQVESLKETIRVYLANNPEELDQPIVKQFTDVMPPNQNSQLRRAKRNLVDVRQVVMRAEDRVLCALNLHSDRFY